MALPTPSSHSRSFLLSYHCVYVLLILFIFASSSSLLHQIHLLADAAALQYSACENASPSLAYGFCNQSLAVSERVADLVARLSLEEKVMQLINSAQGIARLGIPPYQWWNEGLHGVSDTGPGVSFSTSGEPNSIAGAVSFPQVILSAASFNTALWKAIAQVVSTEARGMHNAGLAGLTYWSPNINIFRDPRWGRGQETPGEDPLLTSSYAINYVRGLQDVDANYEGVARQGSDELKVAACCKHYTAYDLENWEGVTRFDFNAEVTQQDLADTFQPPFESCIVEGNAACVMCSYNRVNGVPSCEDKDLLLGIVREKWGLNGYIVSDCDAVEVAYDDAHYTRTPEDAVANALLAGVDLNCGVFLANYTVKAVAEGKVSESKVDEALSYLYTVLMRLGYFNGNPTSQKRFGMLGPSDVCTKDHRELALQAARQGIVLLKNTASRSHDNSAPIGLPFSRSSIQRLAIIGPNANASYTMLGNYAGIPCQYTTPLQGLGGYGANIVYAPGCADVACNYSNPANMEEQEKAVKAAMGADGVVLIMGLDQSQERESLDRKSLSLPGRQQDLILKVIESACGSTNQASSCPNIVLVIMSGGPLDVGFAKNLPHISSIIWVGYPGEAGGQALAEIIYGDYNPAGRLPMSWYPESYTYKMPMTDMHMRPNSGTGYPGRTYRFYTGDTIFEFGDGLSYTSFSHSISSFTPAHIILSMQQSSQHSEIATDFHVNKLKCEELHFSIKVKVKNVGAMEGDHVVMLLWNPPTAAISRGAPKKQLVGFERIHGLHPQEETDILVDLNVCKHLSYADEEANKVVSIGMHTITIEELEHHLFVSIA